MKAREIERARQLRKKGVSVRAIAELIHCSKSSVSLWVRDIPLTNRQIEKLKLNQDRGRAKAANHPNSPKWKWAQRRQHIAEKAQREIPVRINLRELKLMAVALYWAEGYKAGRNLFVFANTDPVMIKLMMRFLMKICKVSKEKFRGRVNIHPTLSIRKAEVYWSKVSGISLKQFHKPLLAVSRASQQKRKTLPFGTFRIIISGVILCSKMQGWIQGIKNGVSSSAG